MELYFLRHGVAEDRSPDGSDFARRLTAEGVEKLRAAHAGLARLKVQPNLLLTSPLVRARQTAEIVGRQLGVPITVSEVLAPGCDAGRLLGVLREHPRSDRVMVVGHEPDFSEMIGALTGGSRVEMKKGALARVDLELDTGWGLLVWLLPPRALR
jgi:phosphohistidine phosphatase